MEDDYQTAGKHSKMKNIIRNISVTILFSPLIALIYLSMLFIGRDRSIMFWGDVMTSIAKQALRFWIPKIETSQDFNKFSPGMKANFPIWSLFYDIEITEDTSDTFKLHIPYCPFCAIFKNIGLSDLNPYICKADFLVGDENKDRWIFERRHQIGTGDSFCDHTYKRIKE